MSYKPLEKQGFYDGATGFSFGSSENPGDNSNPNNLYFNTKSSESQNPYYLSSTKKKKYILTTKEEVMEEYRDFMSRMKENNYEINVSEDRFLELSINQQTGRYDKKSVFEAKGCLELEASGIVKNLRRPDNPEVDLDFVAERVGSGETIFLDHKEMIDFASLADKGKDICTFPSHESVAFNMGKRVYNRK